MKHKHAVCIVAWADGRIIEERDTVTGEWIKTNPSWDEDVEYRIRPPKADEVVLGILELVPGKCVFRPAEHWENPNIRLIFDGETGNLKRATVLSDDE